MDDGARRPPPHRLRVRYAECDPQGVVFNANYLLYIDVGFTEWWRGVYGSYADMVDGGVDVMLVQANLSFHTPARADEELDVDFAPGRLGRTSMALDATIRRADEIVLEAGLHYVFIDLATLGKREVPERVRHAVRGWEDTRAS
jgi:acyl-CoA thioester hydrolase